MRNQVCDTQCSAKLDSKSNSIHSGHHIIVEELFHLLVWLSEADVFADPRFCNRLQSKVAGSFDLTMEPCKSENVFGYFSF